MRRRSPKKRRRLPLPKKAGGPIGTRKGARGYKRRVSKVPENDVFDIEIPYVKPFYEVIDHTADLGIRVTGESLAKLFENAGLALFDLISHSGPVAAATRSSFSVEAENTEALFIQWLRELLYLFYAQNKLFCAFDITVLDETHLAVIGWWERYNPKKHVLLSEIKAVTYHDLYVKKTESGWEAQVIFDI